MIIMMMISTTPMIGAAIIYHAIPELGRVASFPAPEVMASGVVEVLDAVSVEVIQAWLALTLP